VRDFNPDSGTLHIRKSKVHKDRHIVLTEEGQELFGNLAAERKESEVILGREWRTNDQQAPMVATCKRAKIEGASFHTLRHTWALAVINGVPPFIVAKNLGHADHHPLAATGSSTTWHECGATNRLQPEHSCPSFGWS
jgi:integrase